MEGNKLQRSRLTTPYKDLWCVQTTVIYSYSCCLYAICFGIVLLCLGSCRLFPSRVGQKTYQYPVCVCVCVCIYIYRSTCRWRRHVVSLTKLAMSAPMQLYWPLILYMVPVLHVWSRVHLLVLKLQKPLCYGHEFEFKPQHHWRVAFLCRVICSRTEWGQQLAIITP